MFACRRDYSNRSTLGGGDKMGKDMNLTAYAKRTQYKPIDFFFRGIVDAKAKTKKVAFVDAFQILNDRFLGRMSVCNYFVIAESSVRINELNIIALEELKNYHLVMRENFLIPENLVYSLPISVRFLENDKDFDVLLTTLKELGYKKNNIIISFFANTLVNIDEDARKRYARLRRSGYKICVSAYGEEYNALDVLADFNFEYLRCEAQYFDATPSKKKVLAMIVKYCSANKIGLIMEGVDAPAQYTRFKKEGVKYITGKAVSKLSRWVTNEFLKLEEPTGEKKEAYLKKLQKELDAINKAERKELDALREAAIEREKASKEGRILPSAPRPELAKSPYQVRLEQQKLAAKRAADESAGIASLDETAIAKGKKQEKKLIAEMDGMRYQGDVQSALALSFATDKKSELGIDRTLEDKPKSHEKQQQSQQPEEQVQEVETSVVAEELGIISPDRPEMQVQKQPKKPKKVHVDFDKEQKMFNEFVNDSMFSSLGMSAGMGGFGVTMHVTSDDEDEPELVGHYNERGQWVDEDGNTYNGYFNVDGEWVEYERYDATLEGHYNDQYQWVDKDGNVYDGYFDEDGKWIDYTYTDANGEIVDNGYFDDKIGKWVPFGYFDEQGVYHKL